MRIEELNRQQDKMKDIIEVLQQEFPGCGITVIIESAESHNALSNQPIKSMLATVKTFIAKCECRFFEPHTLQ